MKFTLTEVKHIYSNEMEVAKFKKLGFKFKKEDHYYQIHYNHEPEIEIHSIEELMNFINEYGNIVIYDDNVIQIYNGYL